MSTDERDERAQRSDDDGAWRRAYLASLPSGSAACPSDEDLAALALGEVRDERLPLADHLVACRRCAAAYRTLSELHREASPAAAAAPSHQARRHRRLAGWAAAAVVLIAMGVVVVELQRRPRDGEVVRGSGDTTADVQPPHGALLPTPPLRLTWLRGEPGAVYRAVLYDAESVPIWESERSGRPEVVLPAPVRDRLADGGTFYWRVRSEGERGAGASRLYRFEIAR
jgi:hypothetical protein